MYLFILAAAALTLAVILWYNQASGAAEAPPPAERDPGQRLRNVLSEDPRLVKEAAAAIRALEALMAHPELGGPGFLTVQFPHQAPAGGTAIVTAQYPNIREELYRRIVRRELRREELAAAGVPEALLSMHPEFETESGGVVMITVETGVIPPELAECLNGRKERSLALEAVGALLRAELPELSVRALGTDLLLSPVRDLGENACPPVTSINE